MTKAEKIANRVESKAAKVLRDSSAGKVTKSLAGSVLAQSGSRRNTTASSTVTKVASKALGNSRSAGLTKALAATVLSQASRFPVQTNSVRGSSLTKSERVAAVRSVFETKKK